MTIRYLVCLLIISVAMTGNADAAAKKKAKTHFNLIEAYHTQPKNEPGPPPMTGDHFLIKWNEATYPETFFWRGDGGWLTCKIERVHKHSGVYGTDNAIGDKIHKGDTLMLSPVTGGRFPVPAEIPTTAQNTLFYKTGGSSWLSFPVKAIKSR